MLSLHRLFKLLTLTTPFFMVTTGNVIRIINVGVLYVEGRICKEGEGSGKRCVAFTPANMFGWGAPTLPFGLSHTRFSSVPLCMRINFGYVT